MDFHQNSVGAWGDKILSPHPLPRNQTKTPLPFPLQDFHPLLYDPQMSCGSRSCLKPPPLYPGLKAAAKYPHNTLWCVFQPHTYSRTKAFLKDFAKALSLADKVVLADIYASRETDTLGISSKDLLRELKNLGCDCYYFPSFDEIENFLLQNCINGDLLITMGAGDVLKIGENLLGE